MKVLTVLGTRPEIIRLSRVIPLLDSHAEHTLVHTGQNFTDSLSAVFFRELGVREPDLHLGVRSETFGDQAGQILARIEPVLRDERPDRLLVLGDTNSGLVSIVAKRMGIPVFHMEAGNRCYDDRVPEEVNRRIIDHSSSVLLPYTRRSRENLLAEGIPGRRVHVVGNPINQVINHYAGRIDQSDALADLDLVEGRFLLVTLHRAENVDDEDRLRTFVESFRMLQREYDVPVVVSLHPRTRSKIETFGIELPPGDIRFLEPLGFFDFVKLEQSALCVLSDSGTVQEETCIFGVPNVTLRDVTERPETLESGSNALAGASVEAIQSMVRLVLSQKANWQPPPEYVVDGVAEAVVRIVLSHHVPDSAEARWLTSN